jgi:DNA-binding beta-propeller fold protein YncE
MVNALALAISVLLAGSPPSGSSLPLSSVADVPLPGNATRFDYQTIDPVARRLYIAHLGDSSLVVFDLDGQRVIQEVPGLPSVHGVVAAPDLHLLFATATAEKTLALIDDRTFQVQSRVPAGQYPNGLAYDPGSGRVFVSNNSGVGVAVVDAKTSSALPGIDVGGGDLRLAFAACHGSGPELAVVDLPSRRLVQTVSLPPDVDVLAFDPGRRRLYAAAETGTVVAFAVAPDRSVSELGRGFVGPDAHSVAVDPSTHRVYFPLANVNGRPVLRVMSP